MISCTEFIPLYSELFKYLENVGGHDEVVRYWEYISDTYVADLLGKEVTEKGIRGCWDYWSKSLNEEACDFHMELDEAKGFFSIDLRNCPSKGRLNSYTHMSPYHDYCGHCALLYERQLKKYGITNAGSDYSNVDNACCYISFKIRDDLIPSDCKSEKLVMDVKASDNEYFHKDFHISGERGLRYVGEKYGDDAVIEYLSTFTKNYYSPLINSIKKDGLIAMKNHIENIYTTEKSPDAVSCILSDDELAVTVSKCPGVTYMKKSGYEPSKWYIENTRTINNVIAAESGYSFELSEYNPDNGACKYRFF